MHPSVQPPAITKSVVLLRCLRRSDLQTNASFQLYAWQHKEFYLGQLTETGKDTLQKLWEGRSELEMNQTVSSEWFIGLRHWMGHFQNKEGTNAGGVLLPLCFIFYFLHLNKLLHMGTWKSHKGHRLRRPQMHGEYLLLQSENAISGWGEQTQLSGTVRGSKHIYRCVCTNIDCRRLGVRMLDHVGWSSKELLSREHNLGTNVF